MDAYLLKLKVLSLMAETPFIRSLVFGVEGVATAWQAGARASFASERGRPALFADGLAGFAIDLVKFDAPFGNIQLFM
jgi:hypothetical protein